MITIRKATIDDLETVQSFNTKLGTQEHNDFDLTVNPAFASTTSGERYLRNNIVNDERLTLVALDDNIPIGYITGGIERVGEYRTIPSMVEIDNVWIEEMYRNRGVGKELITQFETWARERGVDRMRVIASHKNQRAIQFYTREGFQEYDLILEKDLL